MRRRKPGKAPEQATLDFDAAAAAVREEIVAEAPAQVTVVASNSVVRLIEHQRSRHLNVVRKLLAETGVFRVS